MTTGRDPDQPRGRIALASVLAGVVFILAAFVPYAEFLGADWRANVPAFPRFDHELDWTEGFWKRAIEADSGLHVFGAIGNAQRIVDPHRALFDAGHCHPTQHSLALGEPLIGLGLIATPFRLVLRDPILSYNAALFASLLLAALAMFLLIREWTGDPLAGIVAGLLYAFHAVRVQAVVYPFINDTTGIVLALFFAGRLVTRGGWIPALGFAAAISLQLATSFYPLVASFLLALPFAVGWLLRFGVRRLPLAACLCAALCIAVASWIVYGPYLDVRQSLALEIRTQQLFAAGSDLLPGGLRFPGWLALGLGVLAFVRPPSSENERALEPRWMLLAGAALLLLTAVGLGANDTAPPFFRLLAALLPGLDAVRRPNEILTGLLVVTAALAGLGCARFRVIVPKRARLATGVGLVALTFLVTLRPGLLGLEPPALYQALPIRPAPEKLAFFEALALEGNTGPIFEAPVRPAAAGSYLATRRMVASLYHGRRTSACYSSYLPPIRDELHALADRIPEPSALDRLGALGFTTLVVDRSLPGGNELIERLEAAAAGPEPGVRRLITRGPLSAWAI